MKFKLKEPFIDLNSIVKIMRDIYLENQQEQLVTWENQKLKTLYKDQHISDLHRRGRKNSLYVNRFYLKITHKDKDNYQLDKN